MGSLLLCETEGRVLHVCLDRPEKRNALTRALRDELVARLEAAADDDEVGAVLLTGAGGTFCAGFDLAELRDATEPDAIFAGAQRYHAAVHTFPKPIVVAVNGAALAGGFDLALMCDLRIADESASFGQPQVRHGIPASYELMAHTIGVSTARDLCLTGRIIDAHEALRLRVVTQITPTDRLLDVATEITRMIADQPHTAHTKQRLIAHQPHLFADIDR